MCAVGHLGANYLGPVIMSMKYKENYISYSYYYEYEQGGTSLVYTYCTCHLHIIAEQAAL